MTSFDTVNSSPDDQDQRMNQSTLESTEHQSKPANPAVEIKGDLTLAQRIKKLKAENESQQQQQPLNSLNKDLNSSAESPHLAKELNQDSQQQVHESPVAIMRTPSMPALSRPFSNPLKRSPLSATLSNSGSGAKTSSAQKACPVLNSPSLPPSFLRSSSSSRNKSPQSVDSSFAPSALDSMSSLSLEAIDE